MGRSFDCPYPSKISNAAASILRCIAVQQLSPEASVGNPQMITQPGNRSEIAHDLNFVRRRLCGAQKGNCAGIIVVAVNPLETSRVVVELVQSRIVSIDPVQLRQALLQTAVQQILQ